MKPSALVIGDISLVRSLGRSGIPVVLASPERTPAAASSRFCRGVVHTPSFVEQPEAAVEALLDWAAAQPLRPVLFPQGDHDLLALSRRRERVFPHAHLVLAGADLVEALVDKLRFAELARSRALPVPPTATLRRNALDEEIARWSHYPCVLKPATRSRWDESELQQRDGKLAKAIRIETRADLERLLPLVRAHGTECVLQAAIEGGEQRILSYHAYVRPNGEIAAELTGRKVRTVPRTYGYSTCLEVASEPEVLELGAAIVWQLGLRGVMKMDFKRDERDGRLYLLEINPRFNLWHHPAAVAGVPIPAMVYADCIGEPLAMKTPVRATRHVRWLCARGDLRALGEYRAAGEITLSGWLREVVTADVNEDLFLSDPLPGLLELTSRASVRLGMTKKVSA